MVLLIVYCIAISAGTLAGFLMIKNGILTASAVAVAATVAVIFLGSMIFNNSSVFDPYWSVAPPLMIVFYYYFMPDFSSMPMERIQIVLLLTLVYGIRLTWNFLRGWPGLSHEDWRYADFRKSTGKAYWLVSLSAIHLFPAVMVFGGTLSLWVVVLHGANPLGPIDLIAALVTSGAIFLEAISDSQLRKFVKENKVAGKTMDKGLWSLSRHPNYLGEILFWWGLYLFAVAANPDFWWVIAGPSAITLMFIFASIPLIETRMLKRRKDYPAYQKRVGMLLPWKKMG